jgi:hypothetical protein
VNEEIHQLQSEQPDRVELIQIRKQAMENLTAQELSVMRLSSDLPRLNYAGFFELLAFLTRDEPLYDPYGCALSQNPNLVDRLSQIDRMRITADSVSKANKYLFAEHPFSRVGLEAFARALGIFLISPVPCISLV